MSQSPSTTYGTTLASVRCAHCRYKRNFYDATVAQAALYLNDVGWTNSPRHGWMCPNCFNSKD